MDFKYEEAFKVNPRVILIGRHTKKKKQNEGSKEKQ